MRIKRNPFNHKQINKRWQRWLEQPKYGTFGIKNVMRFKTEDDMRLAIDAYLKGWNDRTNQNIQEKYQFDLEHDKKEPDWITSEMKKGFVK